MTMTTMTMTMTMTTTTTMNMTMTMTTTMTINLAHLGALREQANHPSWGRVVSYLLNSGRISPPEGGHDVGDHPPITPMRAAPRDEFSKGNEWKIYDYVTRHFIATLHDDMTYLERKLIINLGGFNFQYVWHEVRSSLRAIFLSLTLSLHLSFMIFFFFASFFGPLQLFTIAFSHSFTFSTIFFLPLHYKRELWPFYNFPLNSTS